MKLFPTYQGEVLSWSIGLYHTIEQQRLDFPKMRVVIQAMMKSRPEELERERQQLVKDSFNNVFGNNARTVLCVIEDELRRDSQDIIKWTEVI